MRDIKNIILIRGRVGFDGNVEVWAAGRGFSWASLKNEKLK